jgi:hypothetical protein
MLNLCLVGRVHQHHPDDLLRMGGGELADDRAAQRMAD